MLLISSNRTLSPRPYTTDPLLNYPIQEAAAAVGPWLYSSLTSVAPPFSSTYSFGAEDLSPQASSSSTSSSPPAIFPGLSSSSYSITPQLPAAEFGGVMHPNSDEDSSADEDAFPGEPQHHHQQHPHHFLPHPTASSSLKRASPRQVYDLHSGTGCLTNSYTSLGRTIQDAGSGTSNFNHDSPQAPYLEDVRKLTDPPTHTQTHADAHSEQYHHLLSSGPPTAVAPNSLPTPPTTTNHSASGYEKSFESPSILPNETYKFQPPPEVPDHKAHNPTRSSHDLDPAVLHAVRAKIEIKQWEEEKSLYFQIECKGLYVGRVQETNMVNGTKLLNVTGISRGKRDGILKNEKTRKVIKHGTMHLKGVWISYERAVILAEQYGIANLIYPLLIPNLAQYVHVLQPPLSGAKVGPGTVVHHAPKFPNVGLSFMARSNYVDQQPPTWPGSTHPMAFAEPYSAPPQSRSGGSTYEQAQIDYLNSNTSNSDLSERRHTIPNSYNTYQALPTFQGQSIGYPSSTSFASSQYQSYSQATRPQPPPPPPSSNSPHQFPYNVPASQPSSASGPPYPYPPPVNSNTSAIYTLAAGPSTSSSSTNQLSSPALYAAPVPASPSVRSQNPMDASGSFETYPRGQVNHLKREAEDEYQNLSGESRNCRRVQPRVSSDSSPHTGFRHSLTPVPVRYPEWTGAPAQQITLSATDPINSPPHPNASLDPNQNLPISGSGAATNPSNHAGRIVKEEDSSDLVPHSLPPGTSSGSNTTPFGAGIGSSRPNANNPKWMWTEPSVLHYPCRAS